MSRNKKEELDPIKILHITSPTGKKRYVVWNTRTNFMQRCRQLTTARRIEAHWIDKDILR